ncbi:major facilitator superfamily domain-containing protein [Chaetomium tenue]|uniref:Major facilitator superfamily domain-containing protein n=1 Tax=Chaetomium tenue TaxID=1854479 RepID=A0ACB7P249_9PEZI|nr:major facilitator superfamily domain-containing protein [Chaetomium globosum]
MPGPEEKASREHKRAAELDNSLLLRSSGSSDDGSNEPAPQLHARTFLAVAAVCLIYFAQLVSLVGAGVQGQTIGAHFNDTSKVVWFAGSIAIFTVVLGPIVSQAADYWGRKWFLVTLTLTGAVGSVVIARANSLNMAIAGFCLVGTAFGTQPLLHVVASEVLPRRWRGWGQACPVMFSTLGSLTGLFVGAALNRSSDPNSNGFRYYFYMVMTSYLLSAVVCALVYNPPPLPTQLALTQHEKLAKLDWIGYALFTSGIVLFSIGLSYSKNPYEWTDPRVSATFAIGITLSILLILYETYAKTDGLFHHGLFARNRNFALAALAIFFEGLAFFAINSYFSLQIRTLYESDAMVAAAQYSLKFVFTAVFGFVAGWNATRTRRVRWITVASFVLLLAFFVGMATCERGEGSGRAVWGYAVLMGVAFGVMLTTLITVAQLSTPPELISIASGLFISVRSLGGTVGLAVYNAVYNAAMARLDGNVGDVVVPEGLPVEELSRFVAALVGRNETVLRGVPGSTPEIVDIGSTALLDTYVVAFRHVWITAGCFVAVATIASAFLIEEEKEFNMHIDNPIEKQGQETLPTA